MTQLSVKGLTLCTPEFHRIAKRGEELAQAQALVDEIKDKLWKLAETGCLTESQYREIRSIVVKLGW